MYSYEEKLSPNHLEAYLPIPAKADLSMIMVLDFFSFWNH